VQIYLSLKEKRGPKFIISSKTRHQEKEEEHVLASNHYQCQKVNSLLLFIKTTQIVPQNKTKKKLKKQLPWKEQNKKSYGLVFEEASLPFSYFLATRDEETKTWYKKPKKNFLCSLVIREFEEISGFQGPDRFYWYLKFSSKLWS
jgi:hypothetical protein